MGAYISAFLFSKGELSKSQLESIYNCEIDGFNPVCPSIPSLPSSNLGEHYVYYFSLRAFYLSEVLREIELSGLPEAVLMEHSSERPDWVEVTSFESEVRDLLDEYMDWQTLLSYLKGEPLKDWILGSSRRSILSKFQLFFTDSLGLCTAEICNLKTFVRGMLEGVV